MNVNPAGTLWFTFAKGTTEDEIKSILDKIYEENKDKIDKMQFYQIQNVAQMKTIMNTILVTKEPKKENE
jgi:hypothetical protein